MTDTRKERRRLQAKHLWMDIKINWNMLLNRMYTEAPTGMSREQLNDLLFNRAAIFFELCCARHYNCGSH